MMKIINVLNSKKNLVLLAFSLFALAYYAALGAPFYLDDFTSIFESPWIREANSIEPLLNTYGQRSLGYITFWLNFHYIGTSPEAFRYVNFAIHLLTVCTLYVFVLGLLQETTVKNKKIIAYIAALIFLLHPLNTQAVTYVVQRLASLAGFWVLLSCFCFYTARARRMHWLLAVAVIAFMLGFLTKQNAIITPILWYAIDRFVVNRTRLWRFDILGVGVIMLFVLVGIWLYWPTIDLLTRETKDVTRLEYFLAQGPIIWHYLANFVLPINLRLEYGIYDNPYPFWLSVTAWLGHFLLCSVAVLLRKRLFLVTLGIAWYYIAIAVESSIIPISDFAFEHRTYLPNIGLIIALVPLIDKLVSVPRRQGFIIIFVVISALTVTTAHRNYQWSDPYRFYSNELAYNPANQRVKSELARYALDKGKYEKGLRLFEEIVESGKVELTESLLINLMVAYGNVGQWQRAKYYENIALKNIGRMHPSYRARIYLNQGIRLKETGQCEKAYSSFAKVQELFEGEFSSILFRTQCDLTVGNIERATDTVKSLYQLAPDDPRVEAIVRKLGEIAEQ